MPILAGWGGKRKRIGNFGMQKCPNCHNWQSMGIYEVSKQAHAYFIPVAKWGKEFYIICPICEAGIPIKESELSDLLQACMLMPDDETASAIWNELDTLTLAFLEKAPPTLDGKDIANWYEQIKDLTAHMQYRREHINHVLLVYSRDYLDERWTGSSDQ